MRVGALSPSQAHFSHYLGNVNLFSLPSAPLSTEMIRSATPFPLVSLFFMFIGFILSNIGHIRPHRTILAFVSGIFFILSGEFYKPTFLLTAPEHGVGFGSCWCSPHLPWWLLVRLITPSSVPQPDQSLWDGCRACLWKCGERHPCRSSCWGRGCFSWHISHRRDLKLQTAHLGCVYMRKGNVLFMVLCEC